jgi:hypothetical protein
MSSCAVPLRAAAGSGHGRSSCAVPQARRSTIIAIP